MGKILAYLRTSTDKQDLNNQKLEILEYTQKHGLQVDDFISISISSRKSRLDYGHPSSLNYFIKTRKLRKAAELTV